MDEARARDDDGIAWLKMVVQADGMQFPLESTLISAYTFCYTEAIHTKDI
jgi:hypothetical protein